MKTVITGTRSGLGKFLYDSNSFGDKFSVESRDRRLPTENFDTLIHCGNHRDVKTVEEAIAHNVIPFLQEIERGHLYGKRVVFLSSIEVGDPIHTMKLVPYVFAKKMCEEILKRTIDNYVILRCGSIVGPTMVENTLVKMFHGSANVTLSRESMLNFSHMSSIQHLIESILETDYTGTIEVGSNSAVSLERIERDLNLQDIEYGNYTYDCKPIDNRTAKAFCNDFNIDSIDVVTRFWEEING